VSINHKRVAEEFGNIVEIAKKAMMLECVELSIGNGETDIQVNRLDECMTANTPDRNIIYGLDNIICALSGNYRTTVTSEQRRRIIGNPLLKEVLGIAVALNVFVLCKKGGIYAENAKILGYNAERAGVVDASCFVDYTDLKGFITKATQLNAKTTARLSALKCKVPKIVNDIETEFSHIAQPKYDGVRGCFAVILGIAVIGGSVCAGCILLLRTVW
jgi:hypothetical protein